MSNLDCRLLLICLPPPLTGAVFTCAINILKSTAVITCLLRYIPPLLWGKSGHIQTALYGKMGRVNSPTLHGFRKFLTMPDGATATFDLFEALGDHSTGGEWQMLVYAVEHQRSRLWIFSKISSISTLSPVILFPCIFTCVF